MLARIIFAMLALAPVMMNQPHTAHAAPYWPWCSQYGGDMGSVHACAFSSWEQCMQTIRGIGGYCYVNPYGPPAPSAQSPKPHRRAAGN
jgi:hypothetical protein